MEETTPEAAHEPFPGTPGIREVRPEPPGSQSFGFCTEMGGGGGGGDRSFGIRKVGLRAEIDTSPPFGSVKEAVTRFGGSGPWLPLYKLGDGYNGGDEEFDIKKVEEQAAELEKDLIVKELETLDVLEELGTTKKIVEELKLQIQKEALKCMATPEYNQHTTMSTSTPVIKEMNKEHQRNNNNNNNDNYYRNRHVQMNSSPVMSCPVSSPDLILMELKQAKLNLGRTITDLGVIQTSVESLNKKMKKEKSYLLDKARSHNGGLKKNPEGDVSRENLRVSQGDQLRKLAEISRAMLGNEKVCVKTAEMRWVAAKKMEEAAKAAEALAFAEIKSLSGSSSSTSSESASGFFLPEPGHLSKKINMEEALDDDKYAIQRLLDEASAEVKFSKQALEEALSRVEIANRKQIAAGEALRRLNETKESLTTTQAMYSPNTPRRINIFHPSDYHHQHHHLPQRNSPLNCVVNKAELDANDVPSKPVLRPNMSMRDVLSRKQVLPEECTVRRQAEGGGGGGVQHHQTERRKVALSQMLQELREDLTFPRKADQCGDDDHHHDHDHNHQQHQKHFFTQRRKFGFIHISLPLTKQNKKKNVSL